MRGAGFQFIRSLSPLGVSPAGAQPRKHPRGSWGLRCGWRKRGAIIHALPSAREDGGVSGVSSSCGARGGFLPRHDEDLREPLVRRQRSEGAREEGPEKGDGETRGRPPPPRVKKMPVENSLAV